MSEILTGQGSHIAEARKGFIDRLDKTLKGGESSDIKNSKYGYESTVRPYGYTLQTLPDGTIVYNPAGILNKVDRVGDKITRTVDDNIMKEPGRIVKRDIRNLGTNIRSRIDYWRGINKINPVAPRSRALEQMFTGPKRYRGKPEAIVQNAQRLGVGNLFELHPNGVKLTDPTLLTEGINLQDIFRVEVPVLREIDRFDALEKAGQYLSEVHRERGALGEVHSQNFIFRAKEGATVGEPVLGFPNIIPNPSKYTNENLKTRNEPKAGDLLDLLAVISTEELRRSQDWQSVDRALESVLKGYNDPTMVRDTEELVRRGRLPLISDPEVDSIGLTQSITTGKLREGLSWHNKVRLDARSDNAKLIKEHIIAICDKFKPQAQAA